MKIGARAFRRRSTLLAAVGILALVLTACRGVGGGQLPPDNVAFRAPASFGFTFSCEDKGGINPPTGQLRIQLSYTDHGANPLGPGFSIHGIVDTFKPGSEWVESAICSGQDPPPGGNELIFLGRWRRTSSTPAGFPPTCPTRETSTSPLCRFEVTVRDNDGNVAPSRGDYFQIRLSSATISDCTLFDCSTLEPAKVFYVRAGILSSGNLTVR